MTHFRTNRVKALLVTTALCGHSVLALNHVANAQTVEDEIVATGVYIPNEKRITSEITSVLDEEIFAETGAGDIAGALTRVTGLSLSQGKFVIVRGLNERYSNATINGSPLPSPEPLRRVAPLDLFPTSVLSDVVVQKTFDPQYSGEFGGGSIQMSTKAVPDERFFEISVSGSANTETTLKPGFVYDGDDEDWTGFEGGLRDMPALDANGLPAQNFNTFETLIIDRKKNMEGDFALRATSGNRFYLDNGSSIGILGTLGYANEWETRRGEDNTAIIDAGELRLFDTFDRTQTENKLSFNGLLGLGYELSENHNVQVTGLMTRKTSKQARVKDGFQGQEGRLLRQDFTEWYEREVYMGQMNGEHYFSGLNDLEVTWRASYAEANRDAPYERRVNYEDYEDGRGHIFQFNRLGTANEIKFSELDDESFDAGIDFVYPMDWGDHAIDVKFGGAYLDKDRDTKQSNFRYIGSLPEALRESRIDIIFSDAVIDAGVLDIDRVGTQGFPDLAYLGLETYAGYLGADISWNEFLRFAIGFRYEDSKQTSATERNFIADSYVEYKPLEKDYFLPAATATFTFADNWQLRLAASKTINRPQFRELTPSRFRNTDTDEEFVGNPFLTNSKSTNLDARLEYYFSADQFITVGGFYKDLTDPIEEFTLPVGNVTLNSFVNAPSAKLYGLELEFEKRWQMTNLGLKGSWFADKDLFVRSNYTFTDSDVAADDNVLVISPPAANSDAVQPVGGSEGIDASGLYEDGRKLQGQSDHLANLQLGIEDYEHNYTATLLLNYSSERIRSVGGSSGRVIPDVDEELPVTLDFVFNKDFTLRGGDYTLGFQIENILDDEYKATQSYNGNTVTVDQYDIGRTVKASLKRRF